MEAAGAYRFTMSACRRSPRSLRRGGMVRWVRWLGFPLVAGVVLACNSLLGLTDFDVLPDGPDAGEETSTSDGAPTCVDGESADADLRAVCYPCVPLVTEQFLNACTGAQCVPFDRGRLTRLLADGGLPSLPPDPDGG